MKQLINGEEATPTPKQPTAACSDCPWARAALPGWLGTQSAEEWVKVAHSEGSADCHALVAEDGSAYACAGLAIYRANVCKSVRDPKALKLAADQDKVFASPQQFKDHHERRGSAVGPEEG